MSGVSRPSAAPARAGSWSSLLATLPDGTSGAHPACHSHLASSAEPPLWNALAGSSGCRCGAQAPSPTLSTANFARKKKMRSGREGIRPAMAAGGVQGVVGEDRLNAMYMDGPSHIPHYKRIGKQREESRLPASPPAGPPLILRLFSNSHIAWTSRAVEAQQQEHVPHYI